MVGPSFSQSVLVISPAVALRSDSYQFKILSSQTRRFVVFVSQLKNFSIFSGRVKYFPEVFRGPYSGNVDVLVLYFHKDR